MSEAFLDAPSVTEAGADLAGLVNGMAEENGVRITSTLVRSDTSAGAAFTRVAVRIAATGDVQGLAEYLSSIEAADKLLAIRELTVAQSDPSAPDTRAEALHFELLVEGVARIAARGSAEPVQGRANPSIGSSPAPQSE